MRRGILDARPSATRPFRTFLSLWLALALAFSLTPTAAWGQEDAGTAAPEAMAKSAAVPDTAAQDSAVARPTSAPEPRAAARAAGDDLDPYGYAQMETSRKTGCSGTASAADVKAGTTLWANAYDWDDYATVGDYDYQWCVSPKKSTKLADYTAIEGQTSQSITFDADLAARYDGLYLGVSVSDGKTTLFAPQSSSQPKIVGGAPQVTSVSLTGAGVTDAKVGKTVSARAYPADAAPTFAWYLGTDRLDASSFELIEGQTGSTLLLTEAMVGRYLKVTATTTKGDTATVKEAVGYGRVYGEGSWLVDKVSLASSLGAYVGTTLTAAASGRDADHPSAVELPAEDITFTWQVADSSGSGAVWADVPGAAGAGMDTLVADESLTGKYVRVRADGGIEGWSRESAAFGPLVSAPQLSAVELSSGGRSVEHAIAKADLTATALDENGGTVEDNVAFLWEFSHDGGSSWSVLSDSRDCTAPEAEGLLRLTATGLGEGNCASAIYPVRGINSVFAALVALGDWSPRPNSDRDGNLCTMVSQKLEDLGFPGITVTLDATDDPSVIALDGTIGGWLRDDPSQLDGKEPTFKRACVSLTLGKDGEAVTFAPNAVIVGWDRAFVRHALQAQICPAVDLAEHLNAIDSGLDAITKYTRTLPASCSWATVAWTSDCPELAEIDEGKPAAPYLLVNQIERKKLTADVPVVVTAALSLPTPDVDGSAISIDKPFNCTILRAIDVSKVTASELQTLLDDTYTADKLRDFATGAPVDLGAVTDDIQLPIPRDLFVEAHEFSFTVTSSDPSVMAVNGYRMSVTRPYGKDATVTLTVRAQNPSKKNVQATKTFTCVVRAIDEADIDAECALMAEAKAAYGEGIRGSNLSLDAVTGNLSPFFEVFRAADGTLAWARTNAECTGCGIVPEPLDGWYDSEQWRLFRSSDASVVSHENLLVTPLPYHQTVTVSSVLSSQRYGGYYEKYRNDPTVPEALKAKLAMLHRQPVRCTVRVLGTLGLDDPTEERDTRTVTVAVTGTSPHDAQGQFSFEPWIPKSEIVLQKGADDNTTAWQLFQRACTEAGFIAMASGGLFPYGITSPDGRTLASAPAGGQWSYWAFYVNGAWVDDAGPNSYEVRDGDFIELRYLDAVGTPVTPDDAVPTNPDAAIGELPLQWGGFGNGGAGSAVADVATPVGTAKALWAADLLTDGQRAAGASCSASDALMVGGKLYVVSGATTYDEYWTPTRTAALLSVIDPATGRTERTASLARPMDTTCRPVYSQGIIVIPLAGGYLQALSATTLETLWVAEGIDGAQSLSTLTVADGYVYVATADAMDASWKATAGTVRRYNVLTGALAGSARNENAGYYWAGGVAAGNCYLVPDDSGAVVALSLDLSRVLATLKVSDAPIRSSLATWGESVLAVSNDGVLHRIALAFGETVGEGASVTLSEIDAVKFAASSTSTPVVAGGRVFVGGGTSDYHGVLACISLADLSIQSVTSAEGQPLPAAVQGTPLVSVNAGTTCVYFTCNATPGGVYAYRLNDGECTELFAPTDEQANWCMASVLTGPDGTLYYTNDSGYLFALTRAAVTDPDDPVAPEKPEEPGTPTTPTTPDIPSAPSAKPEGSSTPLPNSHPTNPSAGNKPNGQATSSTPSKVKGASEGSGAATANATRRANVAAPSASAAPTTIVTANPAPAGAFAGAGEAAAPAVPAPKGSATVDENPTALAAPADLEDAAVPTWAPIGLILGVTGLMLAILWFARSRRKDGEQS